MKKYILDYTERIAFPLVGIETGNVSLAGA